MMGLGFVLMELLILFSGVEMIGKVAYKPPKFLVVGHRGSGMNALQSSDRRFKAAKENSILSFNAAAKFPVDFIEFDVQVLDLSLSLSLILPLFFI